MLNGVLDMSSGAILHPRYRQLATQRATGSQAVRMSDGHVNGGFGAAYMRRRPVPEIQEA